MKVNY